MARLTMASVKKWQTRSCDGSDEGRLKYSQGIRLGCTTPVPEPQSSINGTPALECQRLKQES